MKLQWKMCEVLSKTPQGDYEMGGQQEQRNPSPQGVQVVDDSAAARG